MTEVSEILEAQLISRPDLLRKWLDVNMGYLRLRSTGELQSDIDLIQDMTRFRFTGVVGMMLSFDRPPNSNSSKVKIEDFEPYVLPNIRNTLNEHDPRVDLTPPGFRGKLFLPQASLLYRMIEMENGIEYDVVQKSVRQKLTSNVGIVAERFSFGKTFLIPALIVLSLPLCFSRWKDRID